jgi:hypothetical protein
MTFGCGISNKTNRNTKSSFQYFWWYINGKKHEKYLGRSDTMEAELKGKRMMLSYYREQDSILHKRIGDLVTSLSLIAGKSTSVPDGIKNNELKKKNFLPEQED